MGDAIDRCRRASETGDIESFVAALSDDIEFVSPTTFFALALAPKLAPHVGVLVRALRG